MTTTAPTLDHYNANARGYVYGFVVLEGSRATGDERTIVSPHPFVTRAEAVDFVVSRGGFGTLTFPEIVPTYLAKRARA